MLLLSGKTAEKLYNYGKNLPIVDYHCHLSPREIYEDKVFSDIGEMWLGGDHYKWRLMRCAGVPEEYITGKKSYREKFGKYIEALETAAGNPLYLWSAMELSQFFGIDLPLVSENAEEIWNRANRVIAEKKLSPRKLITDSGVAYIGTTDDVCDSLEYHALIAKSGFKTKVCPSFRTDKLLMINAPDYKNYLAKLEQTSGVKIDGLSSFKKAVEARLTYFVERGCRISDVGIEAFPNCIGSEKEADSALKKVISGEKISSSELSAFIGNMYVFLGGLYREKGVIMQLHMAVKRNASSTLFALCGPDSGGDCINDEIPLDSLCSILDNIDKNGGLPKTVVYTLNPSMASKLSTLCGSFRNVNLGTAWWFCDHKRGIEEQIKIICETGHIGSFLGMLTDSRSFLSYARHDYFRRIFCSVIGELIDLDEYSPICAEKLIKNVFCGNIADLLGVEL